MARSTSVAPFSLTGPCGSNTVAACCQQIPMAVIHAECRVLQMTSQKRPTHRPQLPRVPFVLWLMGLSSLFVGMSGFGCERTQTGDAEDVVVRDAPQLVVLISLDTLRADRLGCYGYSRNTSPNIDKLAHDSVLFSTTSSQASQTLLSHKSLFTSKYPLRLVQETTNADLGKLKTMTNVRKFLIGAFKQVDIAPMLDGLRESGYQTVAFTDGAWVSPAMGFDRGFDFFDMQTEHFAKIMPRVSNWLSTYSGKPAFLFIHSYDVHCPYQCREPYNSMFCKDHSTHVALEGRCGRVIGEPPLMEMDLDDNDYRAISDHYDGGIANADAYIGDLIARLRVLNLYEESLIVLTSDHGESLGTHNQIGHGALYLEQLLVPLIIKFPTSWDLSGIVIDRPAELVDVLPTIHHACSMAPTAEVDGRSLLDAIDGKPWGRKYCVAQIAFRESNTNDSNAAKWALLDPSKWLLVHDARLTRSELFDLNLDPAGLTNVADRRPQSIEMLLATLANKEADKTDGDFQQPDDAVIDEALRHQLHSLGYLGD